MKFRRELARCDRNEIQIYQMLMPVLLNCIPDKIMTHFNQSILESLHCIMTFYLDDEFNMSDEPIPPVQYTQLFLIIYKDHYEVFTNTESANNSKNLNIGTDLKRFFEIKKYLTIDL